MTWFFDQWIYGTELPTYDFKYQINQNDSGQWLVDCHVATVDVNEDFKMFVPLEIEFENKKKVYIRLLIDTLDLDFNLPPLDLKPKKVILNPFESVLAKVKQ